MSNILNKIGKNLLGLMLPLACAGLGLTGCSDEWDNHYQVQIQGDGTLWNMISNQSDLSNFKRLLDETGYEKVLNGSQVFTVFAPVNDAFSAAECDALIASYKEQKQNRVKDEDNTVIKEFIQNHIALYNYSVSSFTNDTIVMMNYKYQVMGQKSLSDATYVSSNSLAQNGVLFKISKQVTYMPNIYEYLQKDSDLDSVGAFYKTFEVYEFDPNQSVPGGIKDGQTFYLDSVSYLTNNLLPMLGQITREDSSFIVLMPTNEVWKTELERNQKFFVYDKTVEIKDSLEYLFPRLQILGASYYSRTINPSDTANLLVSTIDYLLANGKDYSYRYPVGGWRYHLTSNREGVNVRDYLFNDSKEHIECSNGDVYKQTGTWPLSMAFLQNSTIEMEGEMGATLDSVYSTTTRPLNYVRVTQDNPFYNEVSENGYVEISPSKSANPSALFNVYNVLSNIEYDIKVVTVPAMAGDTFADPLKNRFQVTLQYNELDGKTTSVNTTKTTGYFETSGTGVDTILVYTKSFPACSYALGKANVKLLIKGYTNPSLVRAGTHTTTTRIDKIIFEPRL